MGIFERSTIELRLSPRLNCFKNACPLSTSECSLTPDCAQARRNRSTYRYDDNHSPPSTRTAGDDLFLLPSALPRMS